MNVKTKKIFLFIFIIFMISNCTYDSNTDDSKKKENNTTSDNNNKIPMYDIDKYGISKFVDTDYIELDKIYRVSKFRSGIGHDYSDNFEENRSMKHYFNPKNTVDWSLINIYSPIRWNYF